MHFADPKKLIFSYIKLEDTGHVTVIKYKDAIFTNANNVT